MDKHFKEKVSVSLKRNIIIRFLFFPYVRYKRKKQLKLFEDSPDSRFLRGFKNSYKGKRCFILGNGPSLTITDLDKLKGECCFSSNGILYLLDKTDWRPDFYLCVDIEGFKVFKDMLSGYDIKNKLINISCKPCAADHIPDIHYFLSYEKFSLRKYSEYIPEFSNDISKCVYSGHTVTYVAIQMAAYMGFKEIYLVGCDHNYSKKIGKDGKITLDHTVKTYADGIPDLGFSLQYINSTTSSYECAKKYCDENNIKIYNATRGGKLEVFERVDFDSLF